MTRNLPKPFLASLSWSKTLLLAVGGSAALSILAWGASGFNKAVAGHPDWSFSIRHVFLGGAWLPAALYARWAWQPRRKDPRWHRWAAGFAQAFYLATLLLLGSIGSWKAMLLSFFPTSAPIWGQVGSGILIGLFSLAWALPAISYALARRLEEAQQRLDFRLIVLSGGAPAALMVLAGILGADYGLHGGDGRIVAMALLFALCAVGLAQYCAAYLWRHRPWAKEEEG